jgi:hypothetical protein
MGARRSKAAGPLGKGEYLLREPAAGTNVRSCKYQHIPVEGSKNRGQLIEPRDTTRPQILSAVTVRNSSTTELKR